jgi:hypothetical protein
VVGLEKFFYSLLTIICVGLMTTLTVSGNKNEHFPYY